MNLGARAAMGRIGLPRHCGQNYFVTFPSLVLQRVKLPFETTTMSMITATTWVPRGFAAPFPNKYVFDEDEYERIAQLAKLQLDDAKEELEEAQEKEKGRNGTSSAAEKSKDIE
jgi:hypothetical protein